MISRSLQNLTKLSLLDLSNNQISDIKCIRNLKQLGKLYLSNNNISSFESDLFDNFTNLLLIDLSRNRIKFIKSFDSSLILNHVDLSHNQLSNVSFLYKHKSIKNLILNNNQINHLDVSLILSQNKDLVKINIAINPITHFGFNIKDLNKKIRFSFTDTYLDGLYTNITNDRIEYQEIYSFLSSFYLVTPNNLYHGDCQLKLEFLKRNIHFNLYYQFQIDHFLSKCELNYL